jgi:type IV pilus assembly protein PilE
MQKMPSPRTVPRPDAGFTLIELMIVVAVISVLAAVALPSYLDSVRKSRRSDAIAAIAQVQQAQERYRANQVSYGTHFIVSSGALTGVGVSTDTNATTAYTASSAYYSLGLSNVAATTYSILATAQGTQTSDAGCQYMKLEVAVGNITYKSGSSSSVANGASANNVCWKR